MQKGSALIWIILFFLFLGGIVGGAFYLKSQGFGQNKAPELKNNVVTSQSLPQNTPAPTTTNNAYSGWNKYSSVIERINFSYPPDWKRIAPTMQSNYPDGDAVTFQSPSGEVKVNWVSEVGGLGGGCGDQCPQITILDKTAVKGASGMYVVSGILTSGSNFEPWLAVQDKDGLLESKQALPYDTYQGLNNGSDGNHVGVVFSTGGATASGPDLTLDQAKAWFNKPEVQQAKQILLSLTYQ